MDQLFGIYLPVKFENERISIKKEKKSPYVIYKIFS